jgi:hypothetical protein
MPEMAGLKSSLAVAAILLATTASAQQTPMPQDLAWKLIEIGRAVDPPKIAALYRPDPGVREEQKWQLAGPLNASQQGRFRARSRRPARG